MHISLAVAVAGLIVGFTVGLTGMGGGALMTPILVLLFKVQPLAAVSSDLVAAVIMKPVGGGVHLRRGTVNFALVRWLMVGSVPAAFAGVLVLRHLGDGAVVQTRIKEALGAALLLAAISIAAKGVLQARTTRRAVQAAGQGQGRPQPQRPFQIRPLPTMAIGVLGGLVVGMTSVGSGSLMIVLLLLLYPMLSSAELVGTDLVQAIPLVGSAAFGHILFGDFRLSLTASLLVGSIPGVYLGARTVTLAIVVAAVILVAVPIWGMLDAAIHSDAAWTAVRASKRAIVAIQGIGAIFGVGFVAALVYFSRIRPRLVAAKVPAPAHPGAK